jgi:hypothetical protein
MERRRAAGARAGSQPVRVAPAGAGRSGQASRRECAQTAGDGAGAADGRPARLRSATGTHQPPRAARGQRPHLRGERECGAFLHRPRRQGAGVPRRVRGGHGVQPAPARGRAGSRRAQGGRGVAGRAPRCADALRACAAESAARADRRTRGGGGAAQTLCRAYAGAGLPHRRADRRAAECVVSRPARRTGAAVRPTRVELSHCRMGGGG